MIQPTNCVLSSENSNEEIFIDPAFRFRAPVLAEAVPFTEGEHIRKCFRRVPW
jgi:hypothetical protein